FEIIAAAQDTGGEAAAGPWYERAKSTYTTLVDPSHKVSSLFNLVNVPSAVMVDEEGRIVRINEGTYSHTITLGTLTIGTDEYRPAVRDWVLKGRNSKYVWSRDKVLEKIRRRTDNEALAEPTFKLGVYYFQQHDETRARAYWKKAEELYPDSWN